MRALDLFCCGGGATRGLMDEGATVVGVDIADHSRRYPGSQFIQSDALALDPKWIAAEFDFVWASPPCQKFTNAQRIRKNQHPDLIEPTRQLLRSAGVPYCIENVPEAPLIAPVMLCGTMFPGLRVYRHRLFECWPFEVHQPEHPEHVAPLRKMGRPPREGEFMHVVGNFSNVKYARQAMGMSWATRDELREAIPPAYSAYIMREFKRSLRK